MELNADFAKRAVVHGATIPWRPSPMTGVDRRMLDRVGEEKARATSIVRYAPNSRFSPHVHPGGEEFLVLEGVFQDEHGDYPAGTYVRNPPQSRHTPGSEAGCTILVKLWQFDPSDRTQVRIDTNKMPFLPDPGDDQVELMPLFRDARENVRLERWAPHARIRRRTPGGMELFVLDHCFHDGGDRLEAWSWLRLPAGGHLDAVASDKGCRVWVKSGHLVTSPQAPAA